MERLIKPIDRAITRLGEIMGERARERLGKTFYVEPMGIVMTRVKFPDTPHNAIYKGHIPKSIIWDLHPDMDSVVYECKPKSGGFVLSLFQEQVDEGLSRTPFYVNQYTCIWHLFHRLGVLISAYRQTGKLLDMGSSVEVYPKNVTLTRSPVILSNIIDEASARSAASEILRDVI